MLRTRWIDFVKGFGLLFIVYIHVIGGLQEAGLWPNTQTQANLHTMFDKLGVALFFFTTALFAKKGLIKRGSLNFLTGKFVGLFYPYVVWSVLKWGNKMLLSALANSPTSIMELLLIWAKPMGHLWFLYTLFLAFLIYVCVDTFKGNNATILFVLSLILFYLPTHPATPLVFAKLIQNLPFFALGLLYREYLWGMDAKGWFKLLMAILIGTLTFGWGWFFLPLQKHNALLVLPYLGFGLITVYLLSSWLAEKGLLDWVGFIGRYSLPIYLAHTLVAAAIRIGLKTIGVTNSWGHFFAGLLGGILIPLGLYLLGKRLNVPLLFEWQNPTPYKLVRRDTQLG